MTTRYVSLDPALSTGWAVFESSDCVLFKLSRFGFFDVPHSSEFVGDWLLEADRLMRDLLEGLPEVQKAFVEDYYFVKKYCTGVDINYKIRGIYEAALRRREVPYEMIAPQTWSAWLKPGVPRRRKLSVTESKEATKAAVVERFKLAIPERMGRRKTPSDVYDAIGIGIFAIVRQHPGARFEYDEV